PDFANARPNEAHRALARMEGAGRLRAVITQNIDGLHQEAGSEQVLELHGTNRRVTCIRCAATWPAAEIQARLVAGCEMPECDHCGGILKSATVSFGQAMPEQAMRVAQEWTAQAEVFIVMGSSLQVQPAASFPVMAKRNGALLAIINREAGPLDSVADFVHNGSIGEFCGKFGEMIADG
ncbi:MAG: SIR2 family NAD-dependent protein deacylase, partial [Candidatus Binatia bacterium]